MRGSQGSIVQFISQIAPEGPGVFRKVHLRIAELQCNGPQSGLVFSRVQSSCNGLFG